MHFFNIKYTNKGINYCDVLSKINALNGFEEVHSFYKVFTFTCRIGKENTNIQL